MYLLNVSNCDHMKPQSLAETNYWFTANDGE